MPTYLVLVPLVLWLALAVLAVRFVHVATRRGPKHRLNLPSTTRVTLRTRVVEYVAWRWWALRHARLSTR